jgi:type VI secretion system secreted protein VgrG
MADYTQAKRPLMITTPLGKDVLLLSSFKGQEAISQIFRFQVELLAKLDTRISFDAILGQSVTVELVNNQDASKRHFNGIVNRFTSGRRDETFAHYRAEIVPKLWLLSKKSQSKIFQHLPVPDILKKVLVGFDVKWEITGSYYPRDFCVQYRESDFAFASRLMEEEGIYYFFKHSDGNHTMVVTDDPTTHPDVQGQSSIPFEEAQGGTRDEMRVGAWEKSQELRSAKYTLWDNCFELPNKNLEAKKDIQDTVTVGSASHKLKLAANSPLEVYDYPGGYAQRFDGVDRGGGDRPPDLQEIFKDNVRTVKIRMEQEAVGSLEIQAGSNCGQFSAGHKFTLTKHPDADGAYALTKVEHTARMDHYRSDKESPFSYQNRFHAIPAALPYRPPRVTPRPTIAGTQTAVVVGPAGEEIFVDKYGRVKVQFHWDRDGKKDLDSSCWVRVAQVWAGNRWGAFFWPRIGNEVVIGFEEGDPDQPIIVGCVYNAANLPPFTLPLRKQLGGIKSASVRGMVYENFNGFVFNDAKGHEHLAIHSERNLSFYSEFDKMFRAGRHKAESVSSASAVTVGRLPGGGGSGGGGDAWSKPKPQGVGGLNSMVVYGENLQIAVGLNHQLALGSNIQICINPFGLAAGVMGTPVSGPVSGFMGGGLGGNMQLTIGTSASFVLGRAFDINLGPPKISIDCTDKIGHLTSYLLCLLLSGIAVAWVLAYDLIGDDANGRATGAILFQVAVDAVLALLMMAEMSNKKTLLEADKAQKESIYNALTTRWKTEKHTKELEDAIAQAGTELDKARTTEDELFGSGSGGDFPEFCQGLLVGGILGVGVLPLVGVAWEEGSKFDLSDEDQDKQDKSS